MNSREKGKRGERQWRDVLRAEGFQARRGQQFAGGTESPDVVCEELGGFHFEVKAVERLNIEDAMEQARRDCAMKNAECRVENGGPKAEDSGQRSEGGGEKAVGKVPVVAHRRSFRPWLVTMEAEAFFRLLRGDFTREDGRCAGGRSGVRLGCQCSLLVNDTIS